MSAREPSVFYPLPELLRRATLITEGQAHALGENDPPRSSGYVFESTIDKLSAAERKVLENAGLA
jgi:hypothetical protein